MATAIFDGFFELQQLQQRNGGNYSRYNPLCVPDV
jgi:hypothetical protein